MATSGKDWLPFGYNPRLAARAARLHRLVRMGLTGHESKAELRKLAEQAALKRKPKRIASR